MTGNNEMLEHKKQEHTLRGQDGTLIKHNWSEEWTDRKGNIYFSVGHVTPLFYIPNTPKRKILVFSHLIPKPIRKLIRELLHSQTEVHFRSRACGKNTALALIQPSLRGA